jgi:hypothetical protein
LADGLVSTSYTATGLKFGTTYEFKVESRNSYSYSDLSEALSLYCAFKPEPPLVISTTNVNEFVQIDWDAPVDNGSPIVSYKLYIQNSAQSDFLQE